MPSPENDPLLREASGFFEYRNRPKRDTPWLYAYICVIVLALGGGVLAFTQRNPDYAVLLKPDSLADPGKCPLPDPALQGAGRRRLLKRNEGDDAAWQADNMLGSAAALLGVSAAGAFGLGVVLLLAARHHPALVVRSAMVIQVGLLLGAGVSGLVGGAHVGGAILLATAALAVFVFWLWREQIALVTRLLGVAGRALAANMGLIPLALGLQLGLGLVEVPLLMAALSALMNGRLAYNDARADGGAARVPGECVDAGLNVVPCCAWQVDAWVAPYLSLTSLAALWTVFLVFEIKVFTVAGAVGQWYFEPASHAHSDSGMGSDAPAGPPKPLPPASRRSRVALSLRHAVGPSLGSLCCGSAVLTLASMARQALEKARKEQGRGNLLAACAVACLQVVLALIEFLTKFATIRAALSGEAFFDAGRAVTALLARNALDAYGVWWLPPMVLQSCCAVMAGVWSGAVYAMGRGVWSGMPQGNAAAVVVALVAFVASWAVLGFCAGLLLNVVDAVFVCFGIERDAHMCTRPEVHEVYGCLPSVGPVVEQPDGALAYGAPQYAADPHYHQLPPHGQQYYYSAPQGQQYPAQGAYGGLPTHV